MKRLQSVENLLGKPFAKVTVFDMNNPLGFNTTEAREFKLIKAFEESGRFKYAAIYKEKRKQSQRSSTIEEMVIVEAWGLSGLKEWLYGRMVPDTPGWTTQRFDHKEGYNEGGWDKYLDDYLARIYAVILLDGRVLRERGVLNNAFNPKWWTDGTNYFEMSTNKATPQPPQLKNTLLPEKKTFIEGAPLWDIVTRYERDEEARRACLGHFGYKCKACMRSMDETYGEIGENFIHVHHLKPLSEIGQEYVVDPIRDVCPNCNAMLHRRNPPISIEELRIMVEAR